MRQKFLDRLQKRFLKHTMSLALIEICDSCTKETLILDGKRINFSWNPPLKETTPQSICDTLFQYCLDDIREVLDEQKKKNDNN